MAKATTTSALDILANMKSARNVEQVSAIAKTSAKFDADTENKFLQYVESNSGIVESGVCAKLLFGEKNSKTRESVRKYMESHNATLLERNQFPCNGFTHPKKGVFVLTTFNTKKELETAIDNYRSTRI